MALERTLQFRVSQDMQRELRKDASTLGLSEAEALRHALGLLHRVAQRQRNIHALIAQADVQGDADDEIAGFE